MKQHDHTTTSSQGSRDMRRDPQTRVEHIAAQQLRERKERAGRISIMIDELPPSNHYIEVRDADTGLLIRRMQPPHKGYVQLNFDDQGKFKNANIGFTES